MMSQLIGLMQRERILMMRCTEMNRKVIMKALDNTMIRVCVRLMKQRR